VLTVFDGYWSSLDRDAGKLFGEITPLGADCLFKYLYFSLVICVCFCVLFIIIYRQPVIINFPRKCSTNYICYNLVLLPNDLPIYVLFLCTYVSCYLVFVHCGGHCCIVISHIDMKKLYRHKCSIGYIIGVLLGGSLLSCVAYRELINKGLFVGGCVSAYIVYCVVHVGGICLFISMLLLYLHIYGVVAYPPHSIYLFYYRCP
jgi:hypothetical protein